MTSSQLPESFSIAVKTTSSNTFRMFCIRRSHFRNLCRCFPIDIGQDDPFFAQFGKQCLDFTRSSTHCSGDQGDQVNTVTAFLDGSVIYGASEDMGMRLRGGARRGGGRLVGNTHLPHFLPSKFDLNIKSRPSDKATDFVAGDARAETQVLQYLIR